MVADAYGVISVITFGETRNTLYLHEYKHLMFLQKDDDIYLVDNHHPDYLNLDEFTSYFTTNIKYPDASYQTFVTLKIFSESPTDPSMQDSPFESYYWEIQEFGNSDEILRDNISLPPRISILDGEIIEQEHSYSHELLENRFISFADDEFNPKLNSNGFLAALLSNAPHGFLIFSGFWKDYDGFSFHRASAFNKIPGSLRIVKQDNVLGLMRHNLFMLNLQARINSGADLYFTFQSFQEGEEKSEMRSWKLEKGNLRGFSSSGCESLLRHNSVKVKDNPPAQVIYCDTRNMEW